MKRGPFDILRRALDDTIANWPLIVIRLVETVVFFAIAIATAIVIVAPILVSVGIDIANIQAPEDMEEVIGALANRWTLLIWIFLGVTAMLVVFVALHSLVEAGCARIYVDAERMAGPATEGPQSRFRAFSFERWFAGAREGWWKVFWIYNIAWGLAGVILLIPLLPTMIGTLTLGRSNPAVAIGIGCLGIAVSMLLMVFVFIVTTIWVNRAIVDRTAYLTGARESLGSARSAIRADLGRHVLIALALFVVALAGSAFFSSFSLAAGLGGLAGRNSSTAFMMTLPLRIIGTLCSSAFSAGVTSWFLASYAALAVEK